MAGAGVEAGAAGSGGVAALGGAGGGGGGGGVGAIFESLPVHSGSIVDFRVNPISRFGRAYRFVFFQATNFLSFQGAEIDAREP